jgi:hypothetical protein
MLTALTSAQSPHLQDGPKQQQQQQQQGETSADGVSVPVLPPFQPYDGYVHGPPKPHCHEARVAAADGIQALRRTRDGELGEPGGWLHWLGPGVQFPHQGVGVKEGVGGMKRGMERGGGGARGGGAYNLGVPCKQFCVPHSQNPKAPNHHLPPCCCCCCAVCPSESMLRLVCSVFDVETATVALLTGEAIYITAACGALQACVCPDRCGAVSTCIAEYGSCVVSPELGPS